jgi:hypothetical protein
MTETTPQQRAEYIVALRMPPHGLAGLSLHQCPACFALVVEDFMPDHEAWHEDNKLCSCGYGTVCGECMVAARSRAEQAEQMRDGYRSDLGEAMREARRAHERAEQAEAERDDALDHALAASEKLNAQIARAAHAEAERDRLAAGIEALADALHDWDQRTPPTVVARAILDVLAEGCGDYPAPCNHHPAHARGDRDA